MSETTAGPEALARIDALHTALTQIVLEGGDLAGIAAEVGRVLDIALLVTSSDGRERAAAVSDRVRGVLAEHQLLDPTGRVRVERIGPRGIPVGDGEARLMLVGAGGADLARLVCVRTTRPFGHDDVQSLERAAAVAALLITREAAVTAVENKYQGDFLRDLLMRRAPDPAYVAEHAEGFGWDLRRPVVVVSAQLDRPDDDAPVSSARRRQWQERFAAAWRQVGAELGDGIPSVDFSSEVVTLLPASADEEGLPGESLVHRAVTAVRGDRGGGRRPFSVGVSRVAGTVDDLPEAYLQARRAVEVGRRVQGIGALAFFDRLGLHRLIALVPEQRELESFVADVLGPLAERTEEAADLRETLQVLIDTNFNVAEAARKQFFHYNTMRYRVSKLERLLGPVAGDPHLRLDVAVALRVLDVVA
ncbi:CdaR family transcriptional regulator [Nocardioides sp. CFH 31398]|uniref:PucR family transcriptional regulator n=1 Tax=Nocardioides sp. CFH 31398 TaxID=2919579 RepID=UPI001F06BBB5|nr:helix-turn-helix domain-containing protein [Nocardioides sp. CFH 31398]MCH1865929.1 helix-turn-helix domain-containing protein [Nocardioides sp. CFH 31398]